MRMAQRSAEVRLRWVRCLRRGRVKRKRWWGASHAHSPRADIEQQRRPGRRLQVLRPLRMLLLSLGRRPTVLISRARHQHRPTVGLGEGIHACDVLHAEAYVAGEGAGAEARVDTVQRIVLCTNKPPSGRTNREGRGGSAASRSASRPSLRSSCRPPPAAAAWQSRRSGTSPGARRTRDTPRPARARWGGQWRGRRRGCG